MRKYLPKIASSQSLLATMATDSQINTKCLNSQLVNVRISGLANLKGKCGINSASVKEVNAKQCLCFSRFLCIFI